MTKVRLIPPQFDRLEAGTDSSPRAVSYIVSKGSIQGPAWKAPFIGPFLQSMNPKFEEYYGKWVSGPLSCVSVFHKYVSFFPSARRVSLYIGGQDTGL